MHQKAQQYGMDKRYKDTYMGMELCCDMDDTSLPTIFFAAFQWFILMSGSNDSHTGMVMMP